MRELICNIDCSDCKSDCCRVVCIPFIKYVYDNLKKYQYSEPDEILILGDFVYPFRIDTHCIYLNQELNKCNIYPLRPQICANYGTEFGCLYFNPDGSKLTRNQRRQINRTHDSNESTTKEFRELQRLVKKYGTNNFILNNGKIKASNNLTLLRSLAMPKMSIDFMAKFHPELIEEYDVLQHGKLE